MRSRRATSPSPLDARASDDLIDTPPPDDDDARPAQGEPTAEVESLGALRVCVACGGDPDDAPRAGCDHAEVALFSAPRRAVRDAIERLRRADEERRAAARALRTMVTSEFARGRAEFEARPATPSAPSHIANASSGPVSVKAGSTECPRCAARDAAGQGEPAGATPAAPPRAASRRRTVVATGQQAFAFAAAASHADGGPSDASASSEV